MNKPKNYDNVQAYAPFAPLLPGGHICRILKVEETTSKAGRDMINIYIDTDNMDIQPHYFINLFEKDNRADKKWSNNAIVRQLILNAEDETNKGFKTFIDAVEKSNDGFKVQWGDNFVNCFKNKLVGCVFGREEYLDSFGISKFSTKMRFFTTIEDIKNGIEAPKDKLLNPKENSYDFVPVDEGNMPF